MTKKPKYDDDFKAGALAWLEGQKYPQDVYALARVAKELGINKRTLRRWYFDEHGAPPGALVTQKKNALAELVEGELSKIFGAMGKVRGEASYRDLATAAGILIDKKQLLDGKPTQRIATTVEEALEETPEDERAAVVAEAEDIIREHRAMGNTGS